MEPSSREVSSGHEVVFHLALPEDWAAAFGTGRYEISTRGRSLAEEGFIHCSRADQVETVANAFYADVDELVLLTIDTARVESPIVHEPPAPGVDDTYPHLYGVLPVEAVAVATFWTRGPGGWRLPER